MRRIRVFRIVSTQNFPGYWTIILLRCVYGNAEPVKHLPAEPVHVRLAVASILNGYVVKDQPVTIKLLGGDLEIFWDQQKNTVFMTGPAEVVFDGEIKL